MDWFTKWTETLYNTFIVSERYKILINGFGKTLLITFGALIIGIIIGTIVAIIKVFADGNKKLKPLDVICNIYLTVIRGTPVVVQLLIFFFIIFSSAKDGTWVAIITFGINSGAYVAEIVRSGIMSIDKGQFEAGRSLGLNYVQTMWHIVFPQAFKNILPALGNEFIVLIKETSVAGYVALKDITYVGNLIRSRTYEAFFPLVTVAVIYLAIVMLLSHFLKKLERRLRNSDH